MGGAGAGAEYLGRGIGDAASGAGQQVDLKAGKALEDEQQRITALAQEALNALDVEKMLLVVIPICSILKKVKLDLQRLNKK